MAILKKGDIVGDCDLLKYPVSLLYTLLIIIQGYEFFGNVVAQNDVFCIVIDNPTLFISFFEMQKMYFLQSKKLDGIKYILSTKYKKMPQVSMQAIHRY